MKMPAIGMENANIHHRFAYTPRTARRLRKCGPAAALRMAARDAPQLAAKSFVVW